MSICFFLSFASRSCHRSGYLGLTVDVTNLLLFNRQTTRPDHQSNLVLFLCRSMAISPRYFFLVSLGGGAQFLVKSNRTRQKKKRKEEEKKARFGFFFIFFIFWGYFLWFPYFFNFFFFFFFIYFHLTIDWIGIGLGIGNWETEFRIWDLENGIWNSNRDVRARNLPTFPLIPTYLSKFGSGDCSWLVVFTFGSCSV